MEETQAIDFADFPLEDDFAPAADIGPDQVVGALKMVSHTADSFPLHLGLNVVGRGSSSQADHQGLLDKWRGENPGIPVHGVFLQSNSISSSHAAIYIESGGAVCFIKDLGSRNKTMLGRAGGLTVLQANGDRYSVLQGDKLRFGNVDTVISYSSTVHAQATTGTHTQLAAVQDANLQATEPQSISDRSPTPEMANVNPPSAPVPNTDNDVTLPWDDAPAEQQEYQPEADDNSQGAAMNNETQAVEPMFAETEQQAAANNLLPDTQVNDVPSEVPYASVLASHQQAAVLGSAARSSQDRQTALPAQPSESPPAPLAEPTQLVGEPNQLAIPLGPSSGPAGTSSGPQAGTALASAAAQAMTGAQPTQASILPSSAGFSTGMPSLAPVSGPPAAVASATPAPASEAATSAGQTAGSLPISRPQADAVLHLPSQPSGSQHAAHPHGPPKRTSAYAAAGMSAATAGGEQPGSQPSQPQQAPQGLPAAAGDSEQRLSEKQVPTAEAGVGTEGATSSLPAQASSGHNTLLDFVLGHDDGDSIWMPPASMPGSEGPSQEAEPAVLPPTRGQDLPLQSALLSSGDVQDRTGTAASAAARQPSDSDQTQDSQPEAKEEVEQPAARAPENPAGVASPAKQGRHGRGPAPADQGMYTGAFAFPDSASLGMSQPELDLPVLRGNTLPAGAATQSKVEGEAAAASKTGVISRAPAASAAVPEKAAAGNEAVPAKSHQGKGAARVVPSAWKAKKAVPVVDQPVETTKTGTPPEEVNEALADVKKPSRQLPKPIMHEPDKLSPWRVRGTPLGGAAPPSQLPDSEEVNAAMAAAGQMAAFFPATQVQPDINADTDAVVSAPLPTSVVQPKAADGDHQQNSDSCQDSKAQQNNEKDPTTAAASAAASEAEEQVTAATAAQHLSADDVAQVKSMQTKKGSDVKRPAPAAATAALAGADIPGQVSDGAATHHPAQGHQEAGRPQQEEEVQAPKAAGRGRGKEKGRASVGTRASVDDDEEEQAGKAKAKRGRGSAGAGARGGSRGRGTKASGRGAAAKGPLHTSAADSNMTDMDVDSEKAKAGAVKSKRQRSAGREGSPAVEGSRVSKRQKAKADAQAAEAAQLQEAEEQAAEEDDPFSGAATQAAAGALEELRRSATPEDDQAAEEAAVPMLVPTKKGKRSRSAHPAAASASSKAAAVVAAATLAEGPGDTTQKPGGPSATVPARTRRLSAKGRAAASRTDSADLGSARSSGGNAELATASGQSNASGGSIAAVTAGAAVDDAEKQQGRRQSGSKARGKSRLSRASSPVEAIMESEPDALPVKRRSSIKRSAAKGTAAGPDPVYKRRSGTASSAAQAGAGKVDMSIHAQAEPKGGTDDTAAADAGAGDEGTNTSAKRSGARRKSAPGTGPEAPAASGRAAGSSRRGSRGRAASQGVDAVAAAEGADAAGDHSAAAPASRAKRSRPSNILPDVSASEATAADDMEGAAPCSSRDEEDVAGGRHTGHDPAKGPSGPKASKGKCRRQDMAKPQEDGPASHVKAARKATDNKQVRVLYSTTLDKSKKASMTKIVKRLGGSVEDKEGPEFTHFVTLQPTSPGQTDRGFKKSINALIALAAGRPIVSDSWIDACGRSGSFVDPVDHLLMDTAAQKKFGFDMRTSYERAQHQLLLTGLHVFFTPGMLAAESDKGSNIHNLVGHAGGVAETQLPESVSGKDAKLSTQWLLIADEKDIKREQKWSKGKVASKMPFYGRTMLIDSIMQQALDRKHGVLFMT